MIEFLIFFIGIFLGLTIFAIFGASKVLVATEIDRDFYKRLYEETKEKLAQYEDTGLTPEEIESFKENYEMSRAGVQNLSAKLVKLDEERKYWQNEAFKWASELGEQKLERGSNGHLCNVWKDNPRRQSSLLEV